MSAGPRIATTPRVRAARREVKTVFLGVLVGLCSARAEAFQGPEDRGWTATPERFIRVTRDHAAPKSSPLQAQMGLTVAGYRNNGSPALLWGAAGLAPRNLDRAQASQEALELARAMAGAFDIEPEQLSVAHATALEGFTTVTVAQRMVPQGFLMFVYKNGRLSQIRNELVYALPTLSPTLKADAATALAMAEVQARLPSSELAEPAQLEVWRGDESHLAYRVRARSQTPRSELSVHVDAHTGDILAVDDAVRFADGEGRLRIVVDSVSPDGDRAPFSAVFTELGNDATDGDADTLQNGSVNFSYEGPFVRVRDQSGLQVERLQVSLQGPYQNYDVTPQRFSQADPFVHTNLVRAYARTLTPTLGWLGRRLTVNVNINDTCNAFWDGSTVNFFRQGGGCNNTGQIASIVYHEFGHGYHQALTNNVVGSVGEGTGDYLAATILDDPVVGRGFSTNGSGIRRIDQNRSFPNDYTGQVHSDGLIWGSAMWDLREALQQKHGEVQGRRIADRIFVLALTQGPSLSSAYPAVLSADDDDNNPGNGTPNSCEINAVFGQNGLIDGGVINNDEVPTRPFLRILHEAPGRFVPEPDGSVRVLASAENRSDCGTFDPAQLVLYWAPGLQSQDWQSVSMSAGEATLSGLSAGESFRYWFEIEAAGVTFVNGQDAPHTAVVDLGLQDILREDFESGWGAWTHGTEGSDLVDDWELAAPLGLAFDPEAAREGLSVLGSDLGSGGGPGGSNGAAKPGRQTFVESAPISTEGMEQIRLEFWQHFALDGTLRVLVDGVEVLARTADGGEQSFSGGWRFVSLPLSEVANDRTDGLVVRFELQTNAGNTLGGWALDDFAVVGVELPPPPPPPEVCGDGMDNDQDGATDCDDPDCAAEAACMPKEPPKEPPQTPEPMQPTQPEPMPMQPSTPATPEPPPARPILDSPGIRGGCVCANSASEPGAWSLAFGLLGILLAFQPHRRKRR